MHFLCSPIHFSFALFVAVRHAGALSISGSTAVVTCLYASVCFPGRGGMKFEVYDLVAESGSRDRHRFSPLSSDSKDILSLPSSSRGTHEDEG